MYAGCWHDSAVNQRQVEPELHCFTCRDRRRQLGSTFVFRLLGPSKVISPSSRFKISSDSYIDIDSLVGCLVMRAFWSLHRRSRSREHGWLGEGIGSVVVAPFPVTLTMCFTVKANALNEERVWGTDVDVRANTGFVVAFAQYVKKTWRLKKRTCGKLWGRQARRPRTFEGDAQGPCMSSVQLLSGRRRTFEHCTSCCPSRDVTMAVLTKKKNKKKTAKRRLPLHEKDLLRVGANVGSEIFSQVRSLAADRVSPSASKRQNNHLAPSCRLNLKSCFDKLGHDRSAVIIQRCAACPWISAIFPGGRHYFSPHKMAKKNHWLSWHSRLKLLFLVRNWHCWSWKAFLRQIKPQRREKTAKTAVFQRKVVRSIAAVPQRPRTPPKWRCSFAFFESFQFQ